MSLSMMLREITQCSERERNGQYVDTFWSFLPLDMQYLQQRLLALFERRSFLSHVHAPTLGLDISGGTNLPPLRTSCCKS